MCLLECIAFWTWESQLVCRHTTFSQVQNIICPSKQVYYFMESSTLQTCHKINLILTLMKGEKVKLIQNFLLEQVTVK